jgi:hypothetical protein
MLGEDSRLDVGGAAGGEIDHEVESLTLVKGRFLRRESRRLKSGKNEQAYRKDCLSRIVSLHLILLSVQRSETEYLAKLAGVVVEIEINFLGAYESRIEDRGLRMAGMKGRDLLSSILHPRPNP